MWLKLIAKVSWFFCFQGLLVIHAEDFCKRIYLWPETVDVSNLVAEINELPSFSGDFFDLIPTPQNWPVAGWDDYQTFTGDVDGDGRTDLVWNRANSSGNFIHVGLSLGDGTFNLLPNTQIWPIVGWDNYVTLKGDFNGDGRADFLWNRTDASENVIHVGLSNGDGTLNLLPDSQEWPFGGWDNYQILACDINGDGQTDLVWNRTDASGNVIHAGLSNGDGTFNLLLDSQVWPSGGWDDYQILAGDVNSDGRSDLIWNRTNASGNATHVGLSLGDGTFNLLLDTQVWPTGGWDNYQTLLADVNADGQMDLIWNRTNASGNATHVGISLGDGTFDLLPNTQVWPSGGWDDYQVLAGDLNGDGRDDLTWNRTNASGNAIHVGISMGDGTFSLVPATQVWPLGGWDDYQTKMGDLNNDGRMDLIWNRTSVLENTISVGLSQLPLICFPIN